MVSFWRQVIRGLRLCKRTTVAKNNERTTKTLYQKPRNAQRSLCYNRKKVSFSSWALLSTHQVSSRVESRLRIGANGSHFEAYPFSWFCRSILAHQKQFPKEIPSHGVCECALPGTDRKPLYRRKRTKNTLSYHHFHRNKSFSRTNQQTSNWPLKLPARWRPNCGRRFPILPRPKDVDDDDDTACSGTPLNRSRRKSNIVQMKALWRLRNENSPHCTDRLRDRSGAIWSCVEIDSDTDNKWCLVIHGKAHDEQGNAQTKNPRERGNSIYATLASCCCIERSSELIVWFGDCFARVIVQQGDGLVSINMQRLLAWLLGRRLELCRHD